MTKKSLFICALMSGLLAMGCGGGGGTEIITFEIPDIPNVTSETELLQGQVDTSQATVDSAEEPTDAILLAALQEIFTQIGEGQEAAMSICASSSRHAQTIRWSLALYEQAIAQDTRLLGRDMRTHLVSVGDSPDRSGTRINVLTCSSAPPLQSFNAFALHNVVVMLDPLMDALLESACYWDMLREEYAAIGQKVDPTYLLAGFAAIFDANANGHFGTIMDEAECLERLENSKFALETYWGAVSFVLFHELGHSNLSHAVVRQLVEYGVDAALADAGIADLTPAQQDSLDLAMAKLSRGAETQSDIYAATLLRDLGFSSNGPALLVLGLIMRKAAMGVCPEDDPLTIENELKDCLMGTTPKASHPPLDSRAEIVDRIVNDGEDLTAYLSVLEALKIG